MNPTNVRRFGLLGLIVFDSFAAGGAYVHGEYFSVLLGAVLVATACALLGEDLYERAK